MSTERISGDFYLNESEKYRSTITPRVILLDGEGNFPLVSYKNTRWFGLPGGKVSKQEVAGNANFLSTGSFPTLAREVEEECGIDIARGLAKSACLGLAEINIVDETRKACTLNLTPVYVCRVDNLDGLNGEVVAVNINDHIPGPLFPDARLAIKYLKEGRKTKKGHITPNWLNGGKAYYFKLHPKPHLLDEPPSWLTKKRGL